MTDSDIERAFIYRVFFRRGGKTISQSFVDVKDRGANSEWFSDPASLCMWKAAEELFSGEKDFESVNPFLLTKRANAVAGRENGRDYAELLIDHDFFNAYDKSVNGSDDIDGFCRMMCDKTISRKTLNACQAANDSFVGGEDARSVAASLVSNVQTILGDESKSGRVSVSNLVDEVVCQYDNAYHHVHELGETDYTPGLSLPWRKLSMVMNGFTNVMTVVAARPGVGKTSFAVEMMRYWMDHGVRVVFDSLDMAGVEYVKRQIAEMTQISSRKMQFGKSDPRYWNDDKAKVIAAGERLKQLERDGIFNLYTEPDIDRMKATVRILRDQGKIDVLVVDYIQLMSYSGSERVSTQQKVTHISRTLHAISTEIGIPVLALSQINRDSSKDGVAPQLHNIKDAGAIEEDATNVILLHPNWPLKKKWMENPPAQFMKNPNATDSATIKSLMPMWVIVAKARDGDAGTELPFLVVQNKYSWYQADYEANEKDEMWNRVWDNWKHDSIETVWKNNGALIEEARRKAIERTNMEHELSRPLPSPEPEPIPSYDQESFNDDQGVPF